MNFAGDYRPGTIVINTAERRLYLVQEGGTALRYAIGVGRIGFTWKGVRKVTDKKEWPAWTPPAQMLRRRPDLPRHMAGGIENPLGARAIYLGGTLYRIHGSNEPETHRPGGVVGLLPPDQRRRHRSLRPGRGRRDRDRAVA